MPDLAAADRQAPAALKKAFSMDKGTLSAAAAYGVWGFFPIYFKVLHAIPAFQMVAHRVVWSLLFLALVILLRKEMPSFRRAVTRHTLLIYLGAAALLAINWGTYIWAVNAGFVVESSLGYFINPLVNVLLGVVLLGERLRPLQWAPIGIAAAGVTYLTASYGALPWIALTLAVTFGLYGLVKKVAPLGSLYGLTLETAILFLPALGFLSQQEWRGAGAFGHVGWQINLLVALSGIITAIPLLLFASGARRVPMTILGLLQYIAPTVQFLIGVFLYHEPFTTARLVGFSIIWLALLIYSAESFMMRRRALVQGV
jgi:chloramphenicol-sensitive protein RarD